MPDDISNLDTGAAASAGDNFKHAQHLNVEKLSLLPNSPDAAKVFALWKRKFTIYTKTLGASDDEKYDILINRLDITPYEYVDKTTTYEEAMDKLESIYDKKSTKFMHGGNWTMKNRWRMSQWTLMCFG